LERHQADKDAYPAGYPSARAVPAAREHSPSPLAVGSRNSSIDAFRVVAVMTIIIVHTNPFMASAFDPDVRFYGGFLNQFVRVSNPFFFMVSGYFFAVSLSRGATALPLATKLIKRLMLFFLFWSLVYVLVPVNVLLEAPDVGYWSAIKISIWRLIETRYSVLLTGGRYHLWFLPALICSLALLAVAVRLRLERALMGVAAALFLFGLIAGAYKVTPVGWDLGINTRLGPFYGTVFVVSGFMIYRRGIRITLGWAASLIALGIVLRAAEFLWISGKYGTWPGDIDFLLGTYPFGVGIFALLLSTRFLGEIRWLVLLSRYSPGAYCAHVLVVDMLRIWPPSAGDPLWEVARPLLAFVLTFALVISMARITILKPVVT
jgi:surface polysaccharide O-acyltransferase-like enzyme